MKDTFDQGKLSLELEQEEGLRLYVYDDATGQRIVPGSHVIGHPTIGIGRALDTTGITQVEALTLFDGDVEEKVGGLDERLGAWWRKLTPVRQRVLIEMAFQMGVAGLLKFQGFLDKLQASDYNGAAEEMLNSAWARQTPQRAQRAADRVREG